MIPFLIIEIIFALVGLPLICYYKRIIFESVAAFLYSVITIPCNMFLWKMIKEENDDENDENVENDSDCLGTNVVKSNEKNPEEPTLEVWSLFLDMK